MSHGAPACSVRVPGLHCGRRTSGHMRNVHAKLAFGSPWPAWCLLALGEGVVAMPMLLEKGSTGRKSCSLGGGRKPRAEAAGGAMAGGGGCGRSNIERTGAAERVPARRVYFRKVFGREDFHSQINTGGYY